MTRTQTIVSILEQFDELANPLWSTAGGGSGGPALMPKTYNASVREVERLLLGMRDDRAHPLVSSAGVKHSVRSLWWHVDQRYLKAQRVLRDVGFLRGSYHGLKANEEVVGRPGGWELVLAEQRQKHARKPEPMRVVVTTWHRDVDHVKVTLGIDFLAAHWALAHEPFLPAESLAA